jgi:hypothetical protein
VLPPFVIDPHAVYRPEQVRQALGLRASSLRTEWRAGRLRFVRRCGKNFLLGKDVLAWLDGGPLKPPARPACNGQAAGQAAPETPAQERPAAPLGEKNGGP